MENVDHLTCRLFAILPFILKEVLFMWNLDYCQIFRFGIVVFLHLYCHFLVISIKDLLMNRLIVLEFLFEELEMYKSVRCPFPCMRISGVLFLLNCGCSDGCVV